MIKLNNKAIASREFAIKTQIVMFCSTFGSHAITALGTLACLSRLWPLTLRPERVWWRSAQFGSCFIFCIRPFSWLFMPFPIRLFMPFPIRLFMPFPIRLFLMPFLNVRLFTPRLATLISSWLCYADLLFCCSGRRVLGPGRQLVQFNSLSLVVRMWRTNIPIKKSKLLS